MLNIPRQKALIIIVFFAACATALAQRDSKQKFQADYDAKKVRFGYFLGVTATNYGVRYNNYFLTPANTKYFSVNSPKTFGLKMGGLINFNMNSQFDFRILPTVAIYARSLDINNGEEEIKQNDKAWFELPFLLKYKSLRRGNYRMYMFAGPRFSFETNALNLAQKSKLNNLYTTRTSDLSIEYGAGLEVFQRFFKLAPEITFNHGLSNLIDPSSLNTTTALGVIQKLNTHTVTVSILFE
ncbi:Outer membrane protein beta-barrel domain-containing protein [Spirosomataceae bacterium TFI 002]|nr:Outer membrane protein beta-barrel domain-containing protein [Spirosomataceae bacterium TFI 002]